MALEANVKRYRPRNGAPRGLIEWVSQFLWKWRTELWAALTAAAVVVAVVLQWMV